MSIHIARLLILVDNSPAVFIETGTTIPFRWHYPRAFSINPTTLLTLLGIRPAIVIECLKMPIVIFNRNNDLALLINPSRFVIFIIVPLSLCYLCPAHFVYIIKTSLGKKLFNKHPFMGNHYLTLLVNEPPFVVQHRYGHARLAKTSSFRPRTCQDDLAVPVNRLPLFLFLVAHMNDS